MAQHVPQQKIDDCRELYLEHGGLDHDRIVAEMRGRGWSGFTKRNLYARTRCGRITPGWPERFGWDGELFTAEMRRRGERRRGDTATQRHRDLDRGVSALSEPGAVATGSSRRHRSKPGTAYSSRRTSAREHTVSPSAAMLVPAPPKFNRQKARRLRKAGSADTPVRTDAASAFGNNADSKNADQTNAPHAGGTGVGDKSVPAPPDFHSWLKTLPGIWEWDWRHQIYLYERLKKVTDGTCRRLMIFMPPRHGKSELVTVRYSAWRLKQDPSMNIILGSYNQSLANRFSRKIKRVLTEDALAGNAGALACNAGSSGVAGMGSMPVGDHRNASGRRSGDRAGEGACAPAGPLFPFLNARPINTVAEWETTAGGGLRAVGVGAGVTGYGANLIVIDDPVKSREQANSARFREKLWDWFTDDLRTRLEPNGAIVLIQTRWHEDDLAGRLLREMADGGEPWEIVSLPALAEAAEMRNADCGSRNEETAAEEQSSPNDLHSTIRSTHNVSVSGNPHSAIRDPQLMDPLGRMPGEALCPKRYDRQELERIRLTMAEHSFAALYQQRPVPQEGGVFKRAWFKQFVNHAPNGLDWKRGWDLAISVRTSADYTASFRVAYDKDGNLYIDGGIRRRIDFPEQRRLMIERMRLERDTEHGIELAMHGRAVMQDLRQLTNIRGRRFTGVAVKGDKLTRALKWQSLAAEGRIRLVRGSWNKAFVEEACSFPHGTHDDQIDAVSLAVSMFERKPSKLYAF